MISYFIKSTLVISISNQIASIFINDTDFVSFKNTAITQKETKILIITIIKFKISKN